jgi:Family of unknown function (DUF6476)
MRALKIVVVVMGVMLVGGFTALIVTIAVRVSHRSAPPIAPSPFAGRAIDIPRGAHIEAMTAGTDRLVIDLAMPGGDRQLLIIDLATGASLGTIELHAAP